MSGIKNLVLHKVGTRWTAREEKALISRFNRGISLVMICKIHRRDIGGIISRLTKLGHMSCETRIIYYWQNGMRRTLSFGDIADMKSSLSNWIYPKYLYLKRNELI